MMIRLRLADSSRRLWIKLMISYAVATMTALIAGTLVNGMIEDYQLRKRLKPKYLSSRLLSSLDEVIPWLDPASRNETALALWLENQEEGLRRWQREIAPNLSYYLDRRDPGQPRRRLMLITDIEGLILAGTGEGAGWKHQNLENVLSDPLVQHVMPLLKDGDPRTGIAVSNWIDESPLMIIHLDKSRVNARSIELGLLVVKNIEPPNWYGTMFTLLLVLVREASPIIILVGLFGLLLGWLLGGHFTSRLNRIAAAAETWSNGEFSALADDRSKDELGGLARALNTMAERLRETFALRQQLAASEERNRLARDLHDTVKQQVFALSMQLAAAQAKLEQLNCDPGATAADKTELIQTHLSAAQRLTSHAQQDLLQVIRELKPVDPVSDWSSRLREYVSEWARQNNIRAEAHCEASCLLPSDVQVAVQRILQEACANIARHSQARHVKIILTAVEDEELRLAISDDGRGFDAQTILPGMGLQNMRERAESLLGGWFTSVSEPGIGTKIEAGCRLSLSRTIEKENQS